MAFCLLKPLADAFKVALRDGTIDPVKLAEMSSDDRRAFLSDIVGKENAHEVNTLFERKMLVKDFQRGVIAWAKQVANLKPEVRRGIIDKIERLDERILNPVNEKAFLEDLAAKRLGIEVTLEEAQAITKLSKELVEKKANFNPKTETWTNEKDRIDYGLSRVAMQNFLDSAKNPYDALNIRDTLKAKGRDMIEAIRERPFVAPIQIAGRTIVDMADLSISMVATLDNSFLGRQGLNVLKTHPTKWWNGAVQSFANIAQEAGGKNSMDALRADILSRPNAMNGKYELSGITDPNEEAYPTSFPSKIPVLGRVFKGSEAAFKGSALRMRADVMDLLLSQAKANGVDIDNKLEVKSLGILVNGLTAKGSFGKTGVSPAVKVILWSPKMLKATFDVLTAHSLDYFQGNLSNHAYKEAWKDLFKIVGLTALLLAIFKAMKPDSVETDMTSADFGKIKLGDTRIDITGGAGSMITLAARLLPRTQFTGYKKSTTSDKITEFGNEFGQATRFDALIDYFSNKVTPSTRSIINILKGEDFEGKKVTLGSELKNLFTPIPVQNAAELVFDPSWERAAGVVFDLFGFSGNSYTNTNIKTKVIPEDKKIKNGDFISMVKVYAEAMGTDPETAFNRIFTGQVIRRVDNGAIIVERMPLKDSTAIKKKAGGNNPTMKLDHTIPLQLGGDNSDGNLKMVTTSEWASYTTVENHLGKLLREDKISKTEAQQLIKDFKAGKIKKETILAK